jgi:formamidopyrimidine-DNA glycosylase
MPELPEMQALSERLDDVLVGRSLARCQQLGFTSLKTVVPSAADLQGRVVEAVGRRGKFLVLTLSGGYRVLVHLSQAGLMDLEAPAKATNPRGGVVRFVFDDDTGLLVREYGTQRKAGWWVLGPGEDGPLATLGPEPGDDAFAELIRHDESTRQLHTLLRNQHVVAGIGRGHVDDALNRAGLSPFASLKSLTAAQREDLLAAIRSVLDEALAKERTRRGALSEAKLGDRFLVHNRLGEPCPRCGEPLHRVSFDSHEVVYCTHCQTKGKVLADRRMSKLLR